AHRYSGCIAVNKSLLAEKNLATPQSYQDLLKPEYKNLIAMPNPKSSGTGYIYLKSLVNSMGEDAAFDYFEKLSQNVLQFTSSGSGPINSLVQGEIAIAMGMTSQAVIEINAGQPFEIIYFDEGAPFTACGYGMIKGKETKKAVQEVFDFFYTDLIHGEKEKFLPEKIFEGQENKIENYPKDIPYADMNGNTSEEKERLLDKWIY
ncbi:MAG: extracellular solute-binding protein, partial [Ruminococcaceae bacterium]|nr:extracellular solute-binding protein [Oscillospiraceae bacterium]